MSKSKRAPQRALGFESLESRLPLAGDVMIKVSGGNLTITGDKAANEISIEQTAAGNFTISGKAGENFKVKGAPDSAGPVLVTGVTKDITVKLKAGNDYVELEGLSMATHLARHLTIKTDAGSDVVWVYDGKINGKLTIQTGKDDDIAFVEDVDVALAALVNAGKGADVVAMDDSNFGAKLTIDAGGCPAGMEEAVELSGSTYRGDVKITTKGGNDSILVESAIMRKLTIDTGSGNDKVVMNGVTVDQALINMGAGNDILDIDPGGLVLNGPAKSKIIGGKGKDEILGSFNLPLASQANLVNPYDTGVEAILP